MMISRTIISVKKVASTVRLRMSGTEVSPRFSTDQQNTHPPRPVDNIQLSVSKSREV